MTRSSRLPRCLGRIIYVLPNSLLHLLRSNGYLNSNSNAHEAIASTFMSDHHDRGNRIHLVAFGLSVCTIVHNSRTFEPIANTSSTEN